MKRLFPIDCKDSKFCDLFKFCHTVLDKRIKKNNGPRILNVDNKKNITIVKNFSNFPKHGIHPKIVCEKIVSNFFINTPRWRHPNLQHNVGAGVNTTASVLYSLALDENIYNINDGLAGNVLLAEQVVSNILSELANLDRKGAGLFTFGGTATNYYALKIGLKKAVPNSGKVGIPKNLKIFVTKDSHFSHTVSADWLGIGTDNVITIEPNNDRTSNIIDAENKLRSSLKKGNIISSIIINGGTTYGHVVDDILAFVKLRDKMVKEFSLSYKPHIHVDSVIGWSWLVFKNYNFSKNYLKIDKIALEKIKQQYDKISEIKYADSWGVDFHKGVGGCPVDCSIVMINNINDLQCLSKKDDNVIDMHQLAPEFSLNSPSDYTLETSRSGGPPLAALAHLYTLGQSGMQRNLANLVEQSLYTKKMVESFEDVVVCNKNDNLGYVTMMRLYPPELKNNPKKNVEFIDNSQECIDFINQVNAYIKEFFTWDNKTRMMKGAGVEYSFSSGYITLNNGAKISGIKLYPVSPHFNKKYAKQAIEDIIGQKERFDKKIWSKK
ncbi:MAG: hypothetical protein PHG24_01240 [Candidatus Pacebacteria bacterium]|nr:hypothetical protein [Candidatus Paceibacterota bacterium]